jgi:hypothetical protein
MARAVRDLESGNQSLPPDRRPFEFPARLRVLVPGWPQYYWRQRERAWVLCGSFGVALGTGLLTWGTWVGWMFVAFAFISHVTSTTDALRQGSFPVYPRRTALFFTALALAFLLYVPGLTVLLATSWPGFSQDRTHNGYLVNCWAYRGAKPGRGHWVWLRLPPQGQLRSAQVIAVAGQEVEWTGRLWKVDGQNHRFRAPLRMAVWPQACRFTIPANQVLVEAEDDGASPPAVSPLLLVAQDTIVGRAWAQFYPVWDRRLL